MKMQQKNAELSKQVFRDELTRVGSRAGYLVEEAKLQTQIEKAEAGPFALLVADVNNLKIVNDTMGHDIGDILIQNASRCICDIFAHSPVFRIGGDEFTVILRERDFENRQELLFKLQKRSMWPETKEEVESGLVSIAFGMAEYQGSGNEAVAEIFARADAAMYECKKQMKRRKNSV